MRRFDQIKAKLERQEKPRNSGDRSIVPGGVVSVNDSSTASAAASAARFVSCATEVRLLLVG